MEGDGQRASKARPYHVLDDRIVYVVIGLGTVLTTSLPVFLEQTLCLPLLNALVIFPLFAWALRVGRPRRAIELGLFWAVCQSLAVIGASLVFTEHASQAIWNSLEHRTEVLAWISTGRGPLGTPAAILTRQLRDLLVFFGVTLATGGLGGLALVATALNAQGFTVASLMADAASPLPMAVAAWPIWLLVRLLGFLVCAAVLAEPVAVLDLRPQWWSTWWRRRRSTLVAGIGIVLLGVLLQLLLGPVWASLLRQATGPI